MSKNFVPCLNIIASMTLIFYYLQCSESLSHSLISNVVPSSWMSWLHPCRKMTVALLAVAALMEKMSCGSNILYDNILLNLVLNSPNIISLSLCVILIANGLDDSGRPFRIIVINSPSLRVSSACLNHICETITPVEQSHLWNITPVEQSHLWKNHTCETITPVEQSHLWNITPVEQSHLWSNHTCGTSHLWNNHTCGTIRLVERSHLWSNHTCGTITPVEQSHLWNITPVKQSDLWNYHTCGTSHLWNNHTCGAITPAKLSHLWNNHTCETITPVEQSDL